MIVKIELIGTTQPKIEDTFEIMKQLNKIFSTIHNIKLIEQKEAT